MKYHDNIKRRRKELKITQTELANAVGYSSKSTISKLEAGGIDLSQSMLASIAKALDTTPTALLYGNGSPNSEHLNDGEQLPPDCFPIQRKSFPLLGEIACGEPLLIDEQVEAYITASDDIHADFCIRAHGDSMIGARINDGDIIFIRKQPTVENGQIAAVRVDDIDGGRATLKRVYYDKQAGLIQLVAENPLYPTKVYIGEQLNAVEIVGLAVAFQSKLL